MTTFNLKNSVRIAVLLTTAFASTAALASPPSDAQSQVRALLTSSTHSAAAHHSTYGTLAKYVDAQAQARGLLLGSSSDVLTLSASATDSTLPPVDAQSQARHVLLGNSDAASDLPGSSMVALGE